MLIYASIVSKHMTYRVSLVLPGPMYDTMVDMRDSGECVSIGEAVRHYVRLGMKSEDVEE